MCTVNSLLACVSSDNELKFRCGVLQFGSLSFITWNPSTCFIKKTTTTRQQQQQKQKHLNEGWSSQLYNFYSWEKKAWKKIRLVRDSNPWPLRHWCSLYQLNCTGIAEVKGTNPVRAGIFFSGFLFATAKVANITAMIILHLIRLSVVHIIWFSYIQNSIKKKLSCTLLLVLIFNNYWTRLSKILICLWRADQLFAEA